MQPTLNPNGRKQYDFVFIDRWHTLPNDIQAGDVVALTSPNNQNVSFIKRVIGVEGDFLNTPRYRHNYVIVPRGHCWVEGDNYRSSLDSNKFGPVSLGLIKGKATHIVWPPHRWTKLNSDISKYIPTEKTTYPKNVVEWNNRPKTTNVTVGIESSDIYGIDEESTKIMYDVEMTISDTSDQERGNEKPTSFFK